MKKLVYILLLFALILVGRTQLSACTNIIVTKSASADGSIMVSYAVDSHQLYGELYFHDSADYPAGTMLDIYNWDSGFYGGKIPQVPHTYRTVGNMNEHQLIICETTFGGREELANPKAIAGYGTLIYVTLQRAKTAREAIRVIDELMQNYGYMDEGETFSIADKDECWIMELVGKGEGRKGGVWVALRVPDGYICAHANQSRITKFPLNDPENCMYSPDVIDFAREMGYFSGKDEDFSFREAYCPLKWDGLRGCESRTWSAFRLLGGKAFDADRYFDFASGHNASNDMPLFIKPDHKISFSELSDAMRDHYEGTPLDTREDIGAGPFRLPNRWRPISFEVDSVDYEFERPIATQQTGFWYICQSRGWLPDEIGGLCWFGVDDAATSTLTPIYTTVNSVPHCFEEGNGNMTNYSETSAYWLFTRVAHFAYLFYDRAEPYIRAAAGKYENENQSLVRGVDSLALDMMKSGRSSADVSAMLTKWCNERSQYLFDTWTALDRFLLVKFMDGNVKKQNEDGTFMDNGAGRGIPAMPEWPKHRERWLRAVVQDHGESMKSL